MRILPKTDKNLKLFTVLTDLNRLRHRPDFQEVPFPIKKIIVSSVGKLASAWEGI